MNQNRKIIFKKNINAETFFIITSMFMGILYCLLIPPFQSPDEIRHFLRIYDISNGIFFGKSSIITDNIIKFSDHTRKFCIPSNLYHVKDYISCIINSGNISVESEKYSIPAWLSSIYSPFSYAPLVVTMKILNAINTKIYLIFYTLRLTSCIFSNILIYKIIKIMPFMKWQLSFILLFTSQIFIRSSINSDAPTIILCLYIIYLTEKRQFNTIKFLTSSIFISTLKPFYSIITALSINNIDFKRVNLSTFAIIISAISSILYIHLTPEIKYDGYTAENIVKQSYVNLHTKYDDFFYDYFNDGEKLTCRNVSEHQQQNSLKENPISFIMKIAKTDILYITKWLESITSRIGVLDTNTKPNFMIYTIALFMLPNDKRMTSTRTQKILAIFIFTTIKILIMTALYVKFTPVENSYIIGFQGRYFIPILPLLAFLIPANSKPETPGSQKMRDVACIGLILILCTALASYIKIEYRDHDYSHRYPVRKCLNPPI